MNIPPGNFNGNRSSYTLALHVRSATKIPIIVFLFKLIYSFMCDDVTVTYISTFATNIIKDASEREKERIRPGFLRRLKGKSEQSAAECGIAKQSRNLREID